MVQQFMSKNVEKDPDAEHRERMAEKRALSTLLQSIEQSLPTGCIDPSIERVTSDSRLAKAGSIFVAIRGTRNDGHAFVESAWQAGASALVVQEEYTPPSQIDNVPFIYVSDTRIALAHLAATLYGPLPRPLRHQTVGLTGTNGKTSTTYMLESIVRAAQQRPGVIGTINYRVLDRIWPAPLTTPSPELLWETLERMQEHDASHVFMEVSSHALDQHRIDGVSFQVAGFTNLTQDHLDYHGDLESYLAAKGRLFSELVHPQGRSLLNADDAACEQLQTWSQAPVWTYSTHMERAAHLTAHSIDLGLHGISATIQLQIDPKELPDGTPKQFEIKSPLLGAFHLHNILLSCGVALALGIEVEAIQEGIQNLPHIPGRLERVSHSKTSQWDIPVLVDYAHTPDALEQILKSLRPLCKGRILTVFGCGGDRDQGKRPIMGETVAKASDLCFVTSDNPRTEDPQQIIDHIEVGVRPHQPSFEPRTQPTAERGYWSCLDRRIAIQQAIHCAREGDVVLIAGKGHEDYQIIGEKRYPFSDSEIARSFIEDLDETL